VAGDHPGFVVDEVLGRELAATVAGGQPFALLAQATFHFADVTTHTEGGAGADDLDAALAAGFQTRLPGWEWTARDSPFAVDPSGQD
jgi:phosphatidylglycerophosphatase A